MDQELYTTVESLFAYMKRTAPSESSDDYAEAERRIKAMTRQIDIMANRAIYRTEESTMKYDGDNTNMLTIKDCIDPVVTVDGVEREVYGYPQGKEYSSRIVLEEGYRFNRGRQNVQVTGVHAMTIYLPEDIQHACNVLVAGIYNAADVQGKVGTTESIGNYSVTYRTAAQQTDFETAKKIIAGYRRISL